MNITVSACVAGHALQTGCVVFPLFVSSELNPTTLADLMICSSACHARALGVADSGELLEAYLASVGFLKQRIGVVLA